MSRKFNRVVIIGVGLIGGSLAGAIKKSGIAKEVVGYFRRESSLKRAKRLKMLDSYYRDLDQAVSGSDLIILTTPVYSIMGIGKAIKGSLLDEALIMDAGSTKREIVAELTRLYPENYLGVHPIAGSEKRGVEYADPELFKDRVVILTPTKKTSIAVLGKLKLFWKSVGAKIVILNPETHDKILSKVSHLPHLLMYLLLESVTKEDLKFASSGFHDATRIAASDSKIWSDIFLSNRKNIVKDIDNYIKKLLKYKNFIEKGFEKELQSSIADAASKRRQLG
ncbi:MAG: prephenate dehydrogenase/arogenate dehydrogenase family protein [Candidatus Kaelpia imicola]|nr:prephenate dehydrogenase/arogenate dehydrogenase family protein [Candidatus Kaelpia imicola]